MTAEATQERQDRPPRSGFSKGSSYSTRQVAFAVREERLVDVRVGDRTYSGYVAGADDYHWGIVDGSGQVCLIHKATAVLKIGTATLDDIPEGQQAAVRKVTTAFRNAVLRDHFSQTVA